MSPSLAILCVIVALQASSSEGKDSKFSFPIPGVGLGRAKEGRKVSCKDYDLSVTKLEVCPDSMVTFKDFNVSLSDNCEIIPTGCVTSKAFETAQIKWSIDSTAIGAQGGNEHLSGENDGCKEMENMNDDTLAILKAMKLSTSCPMPDGEQCSTKDNIVDMKKYKKLVPYMWLAVGKTTGDINIQYNNGVSCVKFEVELKSKKPVDKNDVQVKLAKAAITAFAKTFKFPL